MKRAFDVPFGKAATAWQKFLSELGDEGAWVVTQLDDDPVFRRRLARFARNGGTNTTMLGGHDLAREILGADFITPEEVMGARPGIIYADEHLAHLAETMPNEEDLQWYRENGYAIMPAPPDPIALLPIRALKSSYFYSETGGWYADQRHKFASRDKTKRGWLPIRKEPVLKSTSKSWGEQKTLLSGVERVPNAAEVAWFITTYFAVRDVRLFKNVSVRTSSVAAGSFHVCVGDFDARGLCVDGHWGINRISDVGLASARLPAEAR